MKIVQVLHKGLFNTGSVHQMFLLSKGLKERGHEVIIMGRNGTDVQKEAEKYGINYLGLPFKNEFDLITFIKILKFLRKEKPDIIHLHKGLELNLFWLSSFFIKNLNLIANRGVSFPLKFYNSIKYRSKSVKAVICVCDYIREIVIKSGKVKKEKVLTVYAGTDTEEFDPKKEDGFKLREELNISKDEILLCQVGTREWRGWKTAIEAFSLAKRKFKNLKLLFVGAKDEDQIKKIKDFGRNFGLSGELLVLGYRRDNVRIAAAQDIALDFSYEGVGITGTIREGMAMEKPVIASNVGGNKELVIDGKVGFLIPPRNPIAGAEAILKLVYDKDLRLKFGKEGRKRVEENFSNKKRIEKIEEIYKKILKN